MSITSDIELTGIQEISKCVAMVLKAMREYCKPGITTRQLDEYGGDLLAEMGAKSAPKLTYGFPGYTCISINNVIAHGIPSADVVLNEGDLINIDVSAEKDGYWADNGGSFVLGNDINNHQALVTASKQILQNALSQIRGGVKIADIGKLIETEAAKRGYRVIKNLAGHGVGRSLHEEPHDILNYYERSNTARFKKNSVVAVETFISTQSTWANTGADQWTLTGDKGGYVAQHEHTIIVTSGEPIILTQANGIFA